MTPRIIETSDVKKLRAYATRLMAFALKAFRDGDMSFAERLTIRASECLSHAQATEDQQPSNEHFSSSQVTTTHGGTSGVVCPEIRGESAGRTDGKNAS
jgi:hypothetical protein